MGLESASYPNQLVATNPTGSDQKSTADDHIRLLKSVIQTTFPNITGAITAAQADLNKVGVTQPQTSNDTSVSSTAFVQTAVAAAITAIGAGASMWVSGTTYALGNVVWSPSNYQTYRRTIAGSGTTDPASDATNWVLVSGNVQTTATQTLTNKTLTSPVISTISNTGTVTLPTTTDTLVGRATTDTLTNKTLDAPVITGGASISGNVSVTGSVIATVNGSDAISNQVYGQNVAGTRAFNWQLTAAGNPALWAYNGSSWSKVIEGSSSGLAVTSDSVDGNQLKITGATNQNYQIRVGFDTTNLLGKIQAIHVGAAYKDLVLQPDGGNLLVGTTSASYSYVKKSNASGYAFGIENASASNGDCLALFSASASGTGWNLIDGYANGSAVFRVVGNGNVQNANNSYGAISDIKHKQDITDATPKLAKLLRVRIVNYKFKSDPDGIKQIGVIAQELEEISPGLIEEIPDFEEVEVEPARTETKVTQKQKTRLEESVRHETLLCDGQYRRLPIRTDIEVPLFEFHPLFDEDGNPVLEIAEPAIEAQAAKLDKEGNVVTPAVAAKPAVMRQAMHQVPIMEDVTETAEVPAKTERRPTGTTTKSVKYSVFVPMLIKAMQEQQAQIEELKARVGA